MKVITILCMALLTSYAFGQTAVRRSRTETTEFDTLAKDFLKALRTRKMEDVKRCWASVDVVKPLIEKEINAGRMTQDGFEELKKYWLERDKAIAERLPKLIKKFEGNGYALDKLTFVSASGRVRTRDGQEQANSVDMVFSHGPGVLVKIEVDDALKVDGKWLFSDKPMAHWVVEKDGKTTYITIKSGIKFPDHERKKKPAMEKPK